MGNPDLIIIINDYKVIEVLGTEYDIYNHLYDEAIKIAMRKFGDFVEQNRKEAEKPEEVEDWVRKIEVFEK